MTDMAANADIKSQTYVVRGQQVMLDADFAALYGYATKRFNRQVKNYVILYHALYHPLITRLTKNGGLVLKPKGPREMTTQRHQQFTPMGSDPVESHRRPTPTTYTSNLYALS